MVYHYIIRNFNVDKIKVAYPSLNTYEEVYDCIS